jgi:hypothetical protein
VIFNGCTGENETGNGGSLSVIAYMQTNQILAEMSMSHFPALRPSYALQKLFAYFTI